MQNLFKQMIKKIFTISPQTEKFSLVLFVCINWCLMTLHEFAAFWYTAKWRWYTSQKNDTNKKYNKLSSYVKKWYVSTEETVPKKNNNQSEHAKNMKP